MTDHGCIKCGSCLRACPVLSDPNGTGFPGPRTVGVDVPRFPERGRIGERALMCTMCHACEWACPSGLEITGAMLQLRAEVSPGLQLTGHLRMRENVRSFGRAVRTEFTGWREEGNRTLYFPGCIGLGPLAAMTTTASSLLTALGIEHDISSRAVCCGSPLLKVGALAEAKALQHCNMETLAAYERVITSCPGCTYQLREVYGVRAEHMVEVLKAKDLRSKVRGKWALQLPCHLKRGLSPWSAEALVHVLTGAGVDIVRLPVEDRCCGGGGGMLAGFPATARSMAHNKADAYRAAGVEGVITACPFCALNLGREGLRVLDVSEAVHAEKMR